jgi:hypothetical protein
MILENDYQRPKPPIKKIPPERGFTLAPKKDGFWEMLAKLSMKVNEFLYYSKLGHLMSKGPFII